MTDSQPSDVDVTRPVDVPNVGLEKYINPATTMAERIKRIEDLFNMELPVGPDLRPIRNFLDRLYQAQDLILKNEPVPDDFFENPGCVNSGGIEYVVVEPGESIDVPAGNTGASGSESLLGVQLISNNHLIKQRARDVAGDDNAAIGSVPGIGSCDRVDDTNDVSEHLG